MPKDPTAAVAAPEPELDAPTPEELRHTEPAGDDEPPARADHACLTAALAAAQAEFPRIEKNHTAEVRGKEGKPGYTYTYADLGDVLGAVRPVLARHGLALTQRTKYRERDGKLMLLTELRHVGGELLDSELELAANSAPQQFGSTLTYLRRYEAVTLLGVAAEQDLDAADVEPAGREQRGAAPAWTGPATAELKAKALAGMVDVIGDRGTAGRYLATLSRTCDGQFPAVVAGWLAALPQWIAAGQDAARKAAESPEDAAARADAERAAAAAEAGDAPADEFEPTPETLERAGAPVDTDEPGPEPELLRGAFDDDQPLDEPPADAEEPDADRPPGGTVDDPTAGAGDDVMPVRRMELLRAAGCICKAPLVLSNMDRDVDDRCPIKGHGIPF